MSSNKSCLLIIDVQNDFLPPNGSLAVPGGTEVISPILGLLKSQNWDIVVLSRDWHPSDHKSFDIHGGPWPVHCVQGSSGSQFNNELLVGLESNNTQYQVVSKGTDSQRECYSAFNDETGEPATPLHSILKEKGVSAVTVVGVALDYCVKHTALDSASLGYTTRVLRDSTRPVNTSSEAVEAVVNELETAGVQVV
ncbi:hypothetical protein TBLA_0C04280 [Henningerozyma blattae CBS 6284]|uniref:nicotinamidase n=1 Tax=Henningerozyma blattae (strain ATCC 34711 / CBS 6284 / DSM 70876 / NBRC 10599 / NRRL Y-10934 / UCD 77-7) TaxID=1071380 RepID=I2H1H5_HENB6|nr:hypothetical protein TBLA_0C04280 [Tetrapisispora blattae CBS 6284]CCH60227.1 hypothetical protein TBLA_0C04280 [Tetrapisispora blattae CBS 6284]